MNFTGKVILTTLAEPIFKTLSTVYFKLRIASVVTLLVALSLLLFSYYLNVQTSKDLKSKNEWILHTQQVISGTHEVQSNAHSFHSYVRAYLIAENDAYIQKSEQARLEFEQGMQNLSLLVRDHEEQQKSSFIVNSLFTEIVRFDSTLLALLNNGNKEKAFELAKTLGSQHLLDSLSATCGKIILREEGLLNVRQKESHILFDLSSGINLWIILLAIGFLIFSFIYVYRALNRRQFLETQARNDALLRNKILDNLPVVVMVFDRKKKLLFSNRMAHELLHIPEEKNVIQIQHVLFCEKEDDTRFSILHWVEESFLKGRVEKESLITSLHPDLRLNLMVEPVPGSKGETEYTVVLMNDVSLREQYIQNIIDAQQAAQASEAAKGRLLRKVSHEMRTPLNAILGFTQHLLQKEELKPSRPDLMSIYQGGTRLLAMVAEILQNFDGLDDWTREDQGPDEELIRQTLKGKKILAMEDNALNLRLLQVILEPYEVTLLTAGNGKSGIELYEKEGADAILLDLQMPVMDGYEVIHYLRENRFDPVPVIGLSAQVGIITEKERALESGMNAFLGKPFKKGELFHTLLQFLSEKSANSSSHQKPANEIRENATVDWDMQLLEELCNGDEEMKKDMLGSYLDLVPSQIGRLKSALENSDLKEVKSASHRLKSTFQVIKIPTASSLLDFLEHESNDQNILEWQQKGSEVLSIFDRVLNHLREQQN